MRIARLIAFCASLCVTSEAFAENLVLDPVASGELPVGSLPELPGEPVWRYRSVRLNTEAFNRATNPGDKITLNLFDNEVHTASFEFADSIEVANIAGWGGRVTGNLLDGKATFAIASDGTIVGSVRVNANHFLVTPDEGRPGYYIVAQIDPTRPEECSTVPSSSPSGSAPDVASIGIQASDTVVFPPPDEWVRVDVKVVFSPQFLKLPNAMSWALLNTWDANWTLSDQGIKLSFVIIDVGIMSDDEATGADPTNVNMELMRTTTDPAMDRGKADLVTFFISKGCGQGNINMSYTSRPESL
jgi:hypothetical protein